MCIYVAHIYVVLTEVRRDIISPAAGVRSSCELPWGSWDQTPGPLQEQQVLLPIEHWGSPKVSS